MPILRDIWWRDTYATGSSPFQRPQLKIWSDSKKRRIEKELTKLWTAKPNDKERICVYLVIDPKGQGDLQDHMIFYMTYKLHGLSWSLWPISDSIQRIIREISAIESIMTSCLLDRKWHKKVFYEIKFIIILLILKQVWPRSDSK